MRSTSFCNSEVLEKLILKSLVFTVGEPLFLDGTLNFELSRTNKGKLLEFFKKSKADISQLLQKEGGFDKFIATLSTINDDLS